MSHMEYAPPEVRDYGTLLELTADVDAHFFGAMSNLVVAALSSPFGGDVRGRESSGGGGGGDLGGSSGGGSSDSGGAADALSTAPAGGGRLPFTGFPTMLLAGAGAALITLGAAVRSIVRGRPGG